MIGIILPINDEINRTKQYKREWRNEQKRFLDGLNQACEQTTELFELLPRDISLAEKYLEKAEKDFVEGAFSPFWDSIEQLTRALANYDQKVRRINDNLAEYIKMVRNYESTPPIFPLAQLSVPMLSVGMTIAERMSILVRKAQRNYEFSVIYEQRKTNQILVTGFKNLEQALKTMTNRIEASIGDLVSSLTDLISNINQSVDEIQSQLDGIHNIEMILEKLYDTQKRKS